MAGHQPRAIVDAHHHLWELGRFPYTWLAPDAPPRPFGDHTAIKRDYLPNDHRRTIGDMPVVQWVHVQAECGASDPVAETAWLAQLARTEGAPQAAVFHADLSADHAPSVLAANARFAIARGVRAPVSWHPSGRFCFANRPGVMGEPAFLKAASLLPGLGLSLDLVVVPDQLTEVAALAARMPELQIVINHLGTAEPATRTPWEKGVDAIAAHPNIAMKISGLWTIDLAWRAEKLAPYLRHACARLGPSRLLYGSNAPIETLNCTIPRQIAVLTEVLDHLSPAQLDMILAGTARRVYRLPPGVIAQHAPA
ncbi:amidohydrolase family protein [Oceaniglobus trochenteri]|uniref:amidohydrolase family protein n=1 Tax=Oceaniglobus trochenteri TaxID=2763260 RepID=UPI001CFFD9D3|nr:amidohydrolase family protein [Oceaniglobus trochenteri]